MTNRTAKFSGSLHKFNDLVMAVQCLPPWNKCKTIVMIQLQLLF